MELCNQFLAPNGEPSVLYASLLQKYGPDKALQLWNWAQTLNNVEKTDAGEPTLTAVEKLLSQPEVKPGVEELFKDNPELAKVGAAEQYSQYLDSIFPNSKVKNILYHGTTSNVFEKYDSDAGEYVFKFDKLSEETHFGTRQAALDRIRTKRHNADSLDVERASDMVIPVLLNASNIKTVEDQGDSNYRWSQEISTAAAEGYDLLEYVNIQEDKGSISYVISKSEQVHVLGSTQDIEKFKTFVEAKALNLSLDNISADIPFNISSEASKKQMDFHFIRIRDQFGKPTGKYFDYQLQRDVENSIVFTYANFYLASLNNAAAEKELQDSGKTAVEFLKDKVRERFEVIRKRFEQEYAENPSEKLKDMIDLYNAVLFAFDHKDNSFWKNAMAKLERRGLVNLDEDGELLDEAGQIVRSFDDDSLGIDIKQTMSSQMKMFLFTIAESEIGAAPEPEEMRLSISDPQLRANIVAGVTKRVALPPSVAQANNLTAKDKLDVRMSQPEVALRTERLVTINGKQMLAVTTSTDENGNVIAELSPYEKPTDELTFVKNSLGFPQIANTEKLYQELTGLLSERTPIYEDYIKAMKESNSPNVRRVAEKLLNPSTPQHIRNQFMAVMTTHYQRMMMVMVKRSKNGFQETYVFDSNRNSEINMIVDSWREFQKRSDVFVKDGLGGRVIDRNLALGYYDALMEIYNRKTETVEERKKLQSDKRDLLVSIMQDNGIELNDKVVNWLISDKNETFRAFAGFTKEGAPIGVVDIMVHSMYLATDDSASFEEDGEDQSYKANNPLYTQPRLMNELARLQLKYVPTVFSQTHKNTEGKTIYSYGLNTALSHAVRKIATDPTYRKRYEKSVIARNSWLLSQLNSDSILRKKFGIVYMDGLKNALGEREGVTRTNMSDREQWATVLGLFNSGKNTGHLVGMTHADKSKTPVYTNVTKINNVASFVDNGKEIPFSVNRQTAELIYDHVFKSEHKRITTAGGEDIKGYVEGKKHFYFLPMFNYDKLSQMRDKNLISEAEFNQIYGPDKQLNKLSIDSAYKRAVFKVIGFQINQMIDSTYKSWESSGLLDNGLPGSQTYYARLYGETEAYNDVSSDDKLDMNSWVLKNGQRVSKDTAMKHMGWLGAAHYTVNSFMMNVNAAQLF